MSDSAYAPPKVWKWATDHGGIWSKTNRPIAGATHEKALPVGEHGLQLYSLGTPNGHKVSILLEELLESGESGAEYDAYPININEGEQFSSGFVDLNPNSKIPAMFDRENDVRLFESGSILVYLADKFGRFVPAVGDKARAEVLNWLFWQTGSAPYLGGGLGHFYTYAPVKIEHAIDRFAMETKRQLDVLDRVLKERRFVAGDEYSIADMAIWSWYGEVVLGDMYGAGQFLSVHEYRNVIRWARMIRDRRAVLRGRMVNSFWGKLEHQLRERHDASDFLLKTQDKVGKADE